MTEHQRDLLEELLTTSDLPAHDQPIARMDDRTLLQAANAVGPVTLMSEPGPIEQPDQGAVHDVIGFVQRYPIPTLLAVAGAAYLLTRRRRA